ncbi:Type II secretion system protein G [bacterium HR17]|jgi:general secretion pathway protein G|uniref:Type II secretion system core protein G n=1 Tax=Candidatus Fervidibacter japonicus TaxID=2035412 RepID=A0A2H5X912_9BACT|nr:Type II secretion system protein G [bacterium HR17]
MSSQQRRRRKALTLIELVVVMVILVLLASIATTIVIRRIEDGRRTKALMDIKTMETALDLYKADTGSYPTTEQGLEALIAPPTTPPVPAKWNGPYLKQRQVPLDPWGNPYQYESDGENYVLFSVGKDGQPNTDDDVRPD